MAMTFHVDSEVGRLRQAIVHRPDLELKRLTPSNKDAYLFDDVLWVKKAKEEHDAFAGALREAGVEVHQFRQLLEETVAIPEAKKHILDEVFDERIFGPMAISDLRNLFDAFESEDLTTYLIGGISKREILDRIDEPSSIPFRDLDIDDLVVRHGRHPRCSSVNVRTAILTAPVCLHWDRRQEERGCGERPGRS